MHSHLSCLRLRSTLASFRCSLSLESSAPRLPMTPVTHYLLALSRHPDDFDRLEEMGTGTDAPTDAGAEPKLWEATHALYWERGLRPRHVGCVGIGLAVTLALS